MPLLLSGMRGEPGRPWESGELGPQAFGALAGLEAPVLLREGWDGAVPDPEEDDEETAELLAPFLRSFPGLAPDTSARASPAGLAAAVASLEAPMRIGLVVAARPADTLVSIGWRGAANYHDTSAPLTVVLRSWEDRFGATVMHVGFDTVDLLVERPPLSDQAALAVAAEHFAFCLDNISQEPARYRSTPESSPRPPGGPSGGLGLLQSSSVSDWRELLAGHLLACVESQVRLADIIGEKRWSVDVPGGVISFGGGPSYRADLVGSASAEQGTWLWAWANQHLPGRRRRGQRRAPPLRRGARHRAAEHAVTAARGAAGRD